MTSPSDKKSIILQVLADAGEPLSADAIASRADLLPFVVRRLLTDELATAGTALRRARTESGETFSLLADPRLRGKTAIAAKAHPSAADRGGSGKEDAGQSQKRRKLSDPAGSESEHDSGIPPAFDDIGNASLGDSELVNALPALLALTWKPLTIDQLRRLMPDADSAALVLTLEAKGAVGRLDVEAWGQSYFEPITERLGILSGTHASSTVGTGARSSDIDAALDLVAQMPGAPVRVLAAEAPGSPDSLVAGLLGAFAKGLLRVDVTDGVVGLYTAHAKQEVEPNPALSTADVLAGTPGAALVDELPSDPAEALRVLASEKAAARQH